MAENKNLWGRPKNKNVLRFAVSESHTASPLDTYIFQINMVNGKISTIKYVTPKYSCSATGSKDLAIQWASQYNNNLELVKYLLDKGADVAVNNNYVIRTSIKICNLELVKYLIDNNIVDIKVINSWKSVYNTKYDAFEIIKYLVEKGLPFTVNNNELIKWAKSTNQLELVKYLFYKGAVLD